MLFLNDLTNTTSLHIFLVACSGIVANILILSLAINLKHAVVSLRFLGCRGKGHFTDIVMVIVVIQIFTCAVVNMIVALPTQNYYVYLDAFGVTCLLTILSVVATFLSYIHCFCCYSVV